MLGTVSTYAVSMRTEVSTSKVYTNDRKAITYTIPYVNKKLRISSTRMAHSHVRFKCVNRQFSFVCTLTQIGSLGACRSGWANNRLCAQFGIRENVYPCDCFVFYHPQRTLASKKSFLVSYMSRTTLPMLCCQVLASPIFRALRC